MLACRSVRKPQAPVRKAPRTRLKPGRRRSPTLTHFQGEIHPHVDVLGPDVVGGLGVENGVDAAVQVGLAGRLAAAGDSDDGGAGAVPRQHVSRPARPPNLLKGRKRFHSI